MGKIEAKNRIEKLRKTINYHRYLYHVLDKQEISEAALDSLKKELFDLEQEFPDLITPDSPTQRIGGQPLKQFMKVTHYDAEGKEARMNSLNDAFSEKDMEDWLDRLAKTLGKKPDEFYADLKMDGLALELVYENGLLIQASTRGNGLIGEEVINNIRTIDAIPLTLEDYWKEVGKRPSVERRSIGERGSTEHSNANVGSTEASRPNVKIVVRGEVFLTKKEFERINKEQLKSGEKIYANPRNLAAGSIRQLDPKISASRKLDFFAYALLAGNPQTHSEEYKVLNKLGLKTNPYGKVVKSLDEIIKFQKSIEEKRGKLPYEIDGTVVTINDIKLFKKAGVIGKAPRGGIAYKFSPAEATTRINDIIVGVGRTGTLTPVAVLEPVEIGGVTVSRATLHNEDEIKRLDIKIGDTVIVGRAGDVIPDIKSVLKDLRTGKERHYHFPAKCPVCGKPVKRTAGEVAYKCTNLDCPAIKREAVYHFISRGAMDIVGLGPKTIDQLMEAGLIKNSADLYSLREEDLLNLERFAEISAAKTITSIQSRKHITLEKFIYALGIPHVGSETAFDLAREFSSLQKLESASLEELNKIRDIGTVVAQSIHDWFRKNYNKKLLAKFEKAGVIIEKTKVVKSKKLAGLSFVFTGTLDTLTREAGEKLVRENGGDVSSAVSKATSYVVAGEEAGSKLEKAQKFGVKIIDEKGFLDLLK